MVKSLSKLEIVGNFLSLIKSVIYERPIYHIILDSERLKTSPLKLGTKMPTVTISIYHCTVGLSHCDKARKKEVNIFFLKELKISKMIPYLQVNVCIEIYKISTKQFLKGINKFHKVIGYKVYMKKITVFLYRSITK